MANHGINVYDQATSVSSPVVAASGIPFVIGVSPLQSADNPANIGVPVLCTSWNEAVEKLGYSDEDLGDSGIWKYGICEFMYSHFNLYGCQPVIFCNLLNPTSMKTTASAKDLEVTNHKVTLPFEAINDDNIIVKAEGGTGDAYVNGTDYAVYYAGGNCIIETVSTGEIYTATKLNVVYSVVKTEAVTPSLVATGIEAIEQCMSIVGIVPDLICAPGFSGDVNVAAIMATKAAGINGMFKAKALIDISTKTADDYNKVFEIKNTNNFTDENEIVCWPMLKLGDKLFHMSTHLAGLMAQVDTINGGCPYESPSNKAFKCNAMVLEDDKPVNLTLAQANVLHNGGIITALSLMGGIVAWGNYTACYPTNTDVKDYFIPVSRMFDWVGNAEILTFWNKLDKPMNRRLVDSILDTINIWLNSLTGAERLLGGRASFREDENPITSLMAGRIKIHNYITPPSPAQEIDFVLEYDVNYVSAALQG